MSITLGTVITGKNGTLKKGSTAVYADATEIKVVEISVTQTGGTIDVTDSGSGDWREKVPGKRKAWNGSASAFLRAGVDQLEANAEYDLFFLAEDTAADEVYWSGKAVVTEVGVAIPIEGEDAVKVSFNFEGTGSLAKTDSTQDA